MYRRGLKTLDPVEGLVQYVLDIKPYHTKIIDVLIEYIYTDPLNVTILDELFTEIHLYRPSPKEEIIPCNDGYGVPPFGGPGIFPIVSPYPFDPDLFPSIDVLENSFYVPGDARGSFVKNSEFEVESYIESRWDVIDNTVGVPGELIVQGNLVGFINPDDHIFVTNAFLGNGTYVVDSVPTYNAGDNTTTIPVKNNVQVGDAIDGELYVRRQGVHQGTFHVRQAVYDEGAIPASLDPNDLLTQDSGVFPHTIVYVNENILLGIPAVNPGEEYVIYAKVKPIDFVGVVPYSEIHPRPIERPNEYQDNVLYITDVETDPTNTITAYGGDLTRTLRPGMLISVFGSIGNDGDYTVTTFTYDLETNKTKIWVVEPVASDIPDGVVNVHVGSNAFVIDGDYTDRYTQGTYFNVPQGTFQGRYDVAYSTYHKGKTYIRPTQDVLDFDAGYTIVEIVGTDIFVRGDKTSIFKQDDTVVVKNRVDDNGVYTVVADSTYNPITKRTQITVDRSLVSTAAGGEIQVISFSTIKHPLVGGFGSFVDTCKYIPEAMVRVDFIEKFDIRGIGVSMYDDVIAYNLENERRTEIDFPKHTIYSALPPTIYLVEPLLPQLNDLWFNEPVNEFKWYNGHRWIRIVDAFWFRIDVNELWRTTRNKIIPQGFDYIPSNVDGWVLDKRGGYSYLTPAVPPIVEKERFTFIASDLGQNVGETTYTIPIDYYDLYYTTVLVDNIPAQVNWISTTTFDVVSPEVGVGSIIEVILRDKKPYAKDGYPNGPVLSFFDHEEQQNVVINPYGMIPHHVHHGYANREQYAIDYPGQDAYILRGGNYVYRFTSQRTITIFHNPLFGNPDLTHTKTQIESFGVVGIDVSGSPATNTLALRTSSDMTWLFAPGRVFFVDFSPGFDGWYTVVSSTYDGTNTNIEVFEPIDLAGYMNDDNLGVVVGAVYEPNHPTDPVRTIIVPKVFISDVQAVDYQWVGPLHFDIRVRQDDLGVTTISHGKTEIEVDFIKDPTYELNANVGSLPEPNWTSASFGEKLFIMTDAGNVLYLFEQSAGPTPPASPTPGTLWYDTINHQMMVWADPDQDGTYEWVLAPTTPSGAAAFASYRHLENVNIGFTERIAIQVDWNEELIINPVSIATSIGVGMTETFSATFVTDDITRLGVGTFDNVDLTPNELLGIGVGMIETLTITSAELTGVGIGEFDTVGVSTSEGTASSIISGGSNDVGVSATEQFGATNDGTLDISSASFTEQLTIETVSSYPIVDTNTGSNFVAIPGDATVDVGTQLGVIHIGDDAEIVGSGGGVNDRHYIVTGVTYNSGNDTTEVTLDTPLLTPGGSPAIHGTLLITETLAV